MLELLGGGLVQARVGRQLGRVLDVRLVPGLALLVEEDLVDALEGDVGGLRVEEVDCRDEGELFGSCQCLRSENRFGIWVGERQRAGGDGEEMGSVVRWCT